MRRIKDMSDAILKDNAKFGIFSFFTGAGFLDLM